MQKLLLIALSTAFIGLSGCAAKQAAPVIAKPDSTFNTTGFGKTKGDATRDAMAAAKKQCGAYTPVILTDKSNYNGILDERTGRLIEQGVAVVSSVLGTKSPDLARNDDYEYVISFRCQ